VASARALKIAKSLIEPGFHKWLSASALASTNRLSAGRANAAIFSAIQSNTGHIMCFVRLQLPSDSEEELRKESRRYHTGCAVQGRHKIR
jgi:hypothetical protein